MTISIGKVRLIGQKDQRVANQGREGFVPVKKILEHAGIAFDFLYTGAEGLILTGHEIQL